MAIRGIIFDMDGTITAPYLDFAGFKAAAGIGAGDTLDYLRAATGAEYERVHKLLMKFEEDGAVNARLNRGARTLLNDLARRKIPIALLTRNSRKSVETVCRKLKLRFDVTVAREDGPHKPAPEPIWEIARRWKLTRRELLLVGDYKWDVLCAKNAGVRSAVLIDGHGRPEWVKDADFVITRLADVIELVEGSASAASERRGNKHGRAGARPSTRRRK